MTYLICWIFSIRSLSYTDTWTCETISHEVHIHPGVHLHVLEIIDCLSACMCFFSPLFLLGSAAPPSSHSLPISLPPVFCA